MDRNWLRSSALLLALICVAGWMPVAVAGAMKVKATEKVEDAGEVMRTIMNSPDKSIPKDLLRQSAGVAIFPGVIKGGFFIGGKYGKGLVMRHNPKTGRWSPPAFYSIAAASYGLQFGGQSTDLVLVIMNNQGMKGLIKSEFTLGADASVAAGPVGRKAQANVDVELKSAIYSYSRSRGAFIGISLEGSKLNSLVEYNEGYYGKALTPREILFKGKARAPKSALTLMANMRRYAK
ncbi:MAG: lipid-binding SYLF domain-containing protein [Zetaproteobacteria bacterium]|nr:MAG: lipid-binding SYLF domain-containing protein [Zetaproteobacteria bacterium]